ncbi:hypothetical protein DFH08DRAFT_977926 [Mycena albidolilacea]|uniref:Uncharacterized protein n=1 Tax=Mycena albidolilacea TaxID=1033008 RepID=A0AAD6YZM0_9AGAR|nr:hypothetical protein DFH08DRAFT_977926 [Mycena albidolilacea]
MALSNALNPIIHPDIRKHFDGSNLTVFETMITHILTDCHVDGYRTGKITCPAGATGPTTATDWSSATLTYAEWTARNEWVHSTIVLNVIDIIELGMKDTGAAKELWNSIITKYHNKSMMAVAHAKDNITHKIYNPTNLIDDHFKYHNVLCQGHNFGR